jgi:hypothetical protein
MAARILAGRDQEQAAALPVLAFRLRRPLTIGTRSVNCANLDDGTELKRLQLRPTLSMNVVRARMATPSLATSR